MTRWPNRVFAFALALGVCFPPPAAAQLNWRYFSHATDGLEPDYATYLSFSPRGNLLIRYRDQPNLTRLNGYTSESIPGPPVTGTLPQAFRVYESVTGQLWTLDAEGVQWRDSETWQRAVVPEIRDEIRTQALRAARPIPLLPAEHNRLFILLSDRLLKFDALTRQTYVMKDSGSVGLGRFLDLLPARDGGFWITAERGLARVPAPPGRPDQITGKTAWETHPVPDELGAKNLQRPFEDGAGGLRMLAEDRSGLSRVWLRFQRGGWTADPLPRSVIKLAWPTADGKAWGLEPSRLQQWSPPDTELRDMDDLGVRPWGGSDALVETNGAFWVSTQDGVWRYAPASWRPPADAPEINEAVADILESSDGSLWFLGAENLWRLRAGAWEPFPRPGASGQANPPAGRLGEFASGRLSVSAPDGVTILDPASGRFDPLLGPGGQPVRWLGAPGGEHWFVETGPNGDQQLARYDGVAWTASAVPQPDGPLGRWTTLMRTAGGGLWLGGSAGAAHFDSNAWRYFLVAAGSIPGGVTAFADRGGDTIWALANDRLYAFSGQTWALLDTGHGRVNDLTLLADGTVWLATENGLVQHSQKYQTQWIALGAEEGVPTEVRVLRQAADGRLWLGHDRGVSRYHPEVDPEAPQTYFVDRPANQLFYGHEMISVAFEARDRWRATSPERLLYSYRIDDGPWQFSATKRVSFPAGGLSTGQHRVDVVAMDRHLNRDPTPASWVFTVIVPWYQDAQVVGIVLLAAAVALVFAGLAVNRHRRLVRSYAEIGRIVEERTRQLEVANRSLAHAEKMRSLGTLAAGVAHDFNSILSIIRGSIQIIEAHPENLEKRLTRISRIKSMVEQGSTLVNAMRGFSRADDLKLVLEDVSAVVEEAVRLAGDRLPPEVEVKLDITPGLPPVHGSRELLQQMLLNLMFNALDAMEGRGSLTLRCHREHHLPEHWVLLPARAKEYVAVSVEDSGCGISPDQLSRIFEPFFTTKAFSTRHGTGLGLSMVYEFCKELGYGLNVRSALNQGTTFNIVIPVCENPSDAAPGLNPP